MQGIRNSASTSVFFQSNYSINNTPSFAIPLGSLISILKSKQSKPTMEISHSDRDRRSSADSAEPTPSRHTCHCGKSFIRKEHLRRHQATHGERNFVCPICQRSFTRKLVH
ncbi:uncharacterized protein BKA55DRAFT_313663 [Fusarium redolens]|uniref:C2H2-type domain-containing protein n=1 Tax=Fusarium redolens TaxID=48865 RepID=A0A9P9KFI1_FUSRE|nr:uncharacterized protein BKA55DRAFT_313663 [Fusarium redolens]KAH7255330.1 hypothetical protein BKA55DRAFT_313663 [Fusarium redolens]